MPALLKRGGSGTGRDGGRGEGKQLPELVLRSDKPLNFGRIKNVLFLSFIFSFFSFFFFLTLSRATEQRLRESLIKAGPWEFGVRGGRGGGSSNSSYSRVKARHVINDFESTIVHGLYKRRSISIDRYRPYILSFMRLLQNRVPLHARSIKVYACYYYDFAIDVTFSMYAPGYKRAVNHAPAISTCRRILDEKDE